MKTIFNEIMDEIESYIYEETVTVEEPFDLDNPHPHTHLYMDWVLYSSVLNSL